MDGCSTRLDGMREDILREIANIGSGHAASALAALLNKPIVQTVPSVQLVTLAEMPNVLGGADKVVVAGMLQIQGDFSGYLLLTLDCRQAERIISLVGGEEKELPDACLPREFSELEESILCETVNIMGGSYLTAISELTQLSASLSIPYLCVDMVGAVLSVAAAESGKTGDYAVMFQSELYNEKERIIGSLFLIPDEQSCSKVLRSLGFV